MSELPRNKIYIGLRNLLSNSIISWRRSTTASHPETWDQPKDRAIWTPKSRKLPPQKPANRAQADPDRDSGASRTDADRAGEHGPRTESYGSGCADALSVTLIPRSGGAEPAQGPEAVAAGIESLSERIRECNEGIEPLAQLPFLRKEREVDNQVAAPETRTPNLHRAKTAHLRVRMEGWRQ